MLKKFILLFFCFVPLLSVGQNITKGDVPKTKTSEDFKDLKDVDAKTKELVDKWLSKGIMHSVSEDCFGLEETISRAEFAKILAIAVRLKVDTSIKTSRFKDVSINDTVYGYALPYIEVLRKAGVTDGIEFYRFDPASAVTKEQLAVFMIRSLNKEAETRETPLLADETVSDYAKGHVALAFELFPYLITNGPYNGTTPISRQMVVLALEDLTVGYCGCGPNSTKTATRNFSDVR
ncbi:S-layer homology domain-containing protein [Paenibacillus piri]|uniref:SLH domain-containing protein n=1 Tax=Paenibacillus piri TaxID=2547395 RepID=A0A4R5KCP4_9BACL|nr:S-layer homology domain-containing protein [Paenibacillus piri]TDF93041.1 hypothetical protein E1757_28700 [Paenibacillus piri]